MEKSEEFSRSRKHLEDLEVKETDELTEERGEESEEKNENENEEVTVDVMKQCLEENQEFSPYRKDITTKDVEIKETQELTENKEEKSKEQKENEAAVVNMMKKCLKERSEVVIVENLDLTEKKKEKSKEKNENNNESLDTSIVKKLQIKKCDNWYMTKEDVQSDTSYSDLMSGDDADISDEVAEDASVK